MSNTVSFDYLSRFLPTNWANSLFPNLRHTFLANASVAAWDTNSVELINLADNAILVWHWCVDLSHLNTVWARRSNQLSLDIRFNLCLCLFLSFRYNLCHLLSLRFKLCHLLSFRFNLCHLLSLRFNLCLLLSFRLNLSWICSWNFFGSSTIFSSFFVSL